LKFSVQAASPPHRLRQSQLVAAEAATAPKATHIIQGYKNRPLPWR
jgi:hypothetical protein